MPHLQPLLAVNEYTKPKLSTHIMDQFQNYAWAVIRELVLDGITPFNVMFTSSEGSAQAIAT